MLRSLRNLQVPNSKTFSYFLSKFMASAGFLTVTKNITRTARLAFTFSSLSTLSSFSLPFSTLCRNRNFIVPPDSPPVPKKVPFTVFAHGMSWQDPYCWMSNVNDPDFIRYLQQENSYADAFMKDTSELQRTLYFEMLGRMPAKISTPPERWGPWYILFIYIHFHMCGSIQIFCSICMKFLEARKEFCFAIFEFLFVPGLLVIERLCFMFSASNAHNQEESCQMLGNPQCIWAADFILMYLPFEFKVEGA